MKKCMKKQVSLLLSVCFLLGVLVPIPVFGASTPVVTVTFTPENLVQSNTSQQIAMNIHVEPATNVGANLRINYDSALTYVGFESESAAEDPFANNASGEGYFQTTVIPAVQGESITDLGTYYFAVPACKVGDSYVFKVDNIQVYNPDKFEAQDVTETLVVSEGRTVELFGPASAFAGGSDDTVTYTIAVTGDAYQSAELKLAYDSDLLEFGETNDKETMTAKNGVVTIVQYGENQSPTYTVKFKTKGVGNAVTTLTSAAFGTSNTAVSGDLTSATITKASVSTEINKAAFTVILPEGVTGDTTVNYGGNYTFTPTFAEPTKYDYVVTATMDGQPVTVTNNNDGTYTIANVTGDLKIVMTQTPKQYQITFQTNNSAAVLPAAATVTYGAPYTFNLPEETDCILAVTNATIGGAPYKCPDVVNGEVTIPGEVITGDIVITIDRVSAQITVNGNGAADATCADIVEIGEDCVLTLEKETGYVYTVTAKMDDEPVAVTEGAEGKYIVSDVTGPVAFTVQKTIDINGILITEYMKVDSNAVWLVQNTASKLNGSVYSYAGTEMVWSEAHNAYCCLVISQTEPENSADKLTLTSGTTTVLSHSADVNQSGKVDANDAQLVYDLYNGKYSDFSVVSMNKFLLADVNQNLVVDILDAAAVVSAIVQ